MKPQFGASGGVRGRGGSSLHGGGVLAAEDVQHDRCLAERGRGAGVVPGVAKGRGRDGQAAH